MNYPFESPTRKRRAGISVSPTKSLNTSPLQLPQSPEKTLPPCAYSPLKAPKSPVKMRQGSTPSTAKGSNALRVNLLGVGVLLTLILQCTLLVHKVPEYGGGLRMSTRKSSDTERLLDTANGERRASGREHMNSVADEASERGPANDEIESSTRNDGEPTNADVVAPAVTNTMADKISVTETANKEIESSTGNDTRPTNTEAVTPAAINSLADEASVTEIAKNEIESSTRNDTRPTNTEVAAPAIPSTRSKKGPKKADVVVAGISLTKTDEVPVNDQAAPSVSTPFQFAYSYIVGGCDPDRPVYRNFLYNILINTYLMQQDGSQADVIVFIQMLYSSKHKTLPLDDLRLMSAMNIQVQYIQADADNGFDLLMMEKFRVLGLTDYERVVFLDADILLRGSLDYLLELSVKGILKENIVFAGRYVPASGGLFVVTPGHRDSLLEILARTDRNASSWDVKQGWGQAFEGGDSYELINGKKSNRWDFHGASMDQGLLYHVVKYEKKSVSIVLKKSIQNWGSGESGKVQVEEILTLEDAVGGLSTKHNCWEALMGHKPCTAPHSDFLHFPGGMKPWLQAPPANFSDNPEEGPSHFWFYTLSVLNKKLEIGLDFEHWQKQQRPLFGYQSSNSDLVPKSIDAVPHTATMPTKAHFDTKKNAADFAYAYVVGGCDPNEPVYRNFINNILINTHLQRGEGSKVDVVVFVQMSYDSGYDELPDSDIRVLTAMNIKILYIPKTEHESFERLMFDKFRVLGLTQYKRVLFMDGDIMVRGSLDYLFQLSVKGAIKENLVLAGRLEPAIGGLFMVAPKDGDWDRIVSVIRNKEECGASLPAPYFDKVKGWGNEFNGTDTYELLSGKKRNLWDFAGSSSDQGLLYSWVRFEKKSVSIVLKDMVQNWGVDQDGNVQLEETIGIDIFTGHANERECWKASLSHKPCTPPHSDYVHFPGHKKPWMKHGPPADLFNVTEMSSPTHFWFRTLMTLNDKLDLGLDFVHWENKGTPLLGVRANNHDLAGTTYADSASKKFASPYTSYMTNTTRPHRFAYAYVVGGCKPEDPAYRNYFNDIIISTYLIREEGSQADVIVFVQMSYESSFDTLPDTDLNLLSAVDIIVKYIPKAEDESFYRIMLDKFLVLGLTQYERVLFMDGDVMARGSLDYLFELSVKGILKKNLVVAGQSEPASGGFFMVTPTETSRDRIMEIIRAKEERGALWDEVKGWGHTIDENDYYELFGGDKKKKWNFYGAFADQGLLYHWVKYEEKSVSIIMRNNIQNWDVGEDGKVHLETTLRLNVFDKVSVKRDACWTEIMMHKPCTAPHSDFVHFTGTKKPWLRGPPEDMYEAPGSKSAWHYWFHTLSVLNDKMQIGLDFRNWRSHHRPSLGLFPKEDDAAQTKYASAAINT